MRIQVRQTVGASAFMVCKFLWRRRYITIGLLLLLLLLLLDAHMSYHAQLGEALGSDSIPPPYYPRLSDNDEPSHWQTKPLATLQHINSILRSRWARYNGIGVQTRPAPAQHEPGTPAQPAPSDSSSTSAADAPASKLLSSPTMRRPCGPHIEHNKHWADRRLWRSLGAEKIWEKRRSWRKFLAEDVPKVQYGNFSFEGRGVVYTASSTTLPRALTSIRLLRNLGCLLPIEVWFMGGELEAEHLAEIRDIGAEPRDLLVVQKQHDILRAFQLRHAYGGQRNYHIKTMVLLFSRFQEILYLDSDNNPLRDPTFLFDSAAYVDTGAIFWPDFWKFPIDNPMWKITGQTCEDEWEQESGQLVIDKQRSWNALLMSLFLQMDHQFYFQIILGDKDTFRFGWKMTKTPYHMVRSPISIGGRIRQGRFCGHTMFQHDPSGGLLFAHASPLKTTNAVRNGNTWEAIQYLEWNEPVTLPPPSKNTLAFSVGYPVAFEYAGGISRPSDEGGTGPETWMNPCVSYALQKNVTVETTVATVDAWGPNAIDSYRIVTEDFSTYQGGRFRWFEPAYFRHGGPDSTHDDLLSATFKNYFW